MRAGTNRDSKTFTTEKAKDGGKKSKTALEISNAKMTEMQLCALPVWTAITRSNHPAFVQQNKPLPRLS